MFFKPRYKFGEIAKRWGDTNFKKEFDSKLDDWLKQFDPRDIPILLDLLKNFYYYTETAINQKVVELHPACFCRFPILKLLVKMCLVFLQAVLESVPFRFAAFLENCRFFDYAFFSLLLVIFYHSNDKMSTTRRESYSFFALSSFSCAGGDVLIWLLHCDTVKWLMRCNNRYNDGGEFYSCGMMMESYASLLKRGEQIKLKNVSAIV